MNIVDLKTAIIENTLDDKLIVFVCSNDKANSNGKYLANDYIEAICNNKHLNKVYINSLSDVMDSALSLVMDFSTQLNIINTDVFEEIRQDYDNASNIVVVCNSVDKKIIDSLNAYIVEMPKFEDWQIIDYVKAMCPGLENDLDDITWLCKAANNDLYKIRNEIDKVALFTGSEQSNILKDIRYDDNSDLYWSDDKDTIVEYILNNNRQAISNLLAHKNAVTIDPLMIVGRLLGEYKKIMLARHIITNKLKPENYGLKSDKQAAFLANRYRVLDANKVIDRIEFLSEINQKLVRGDLDFVGNTAQAKQEALLNYVLCGVLN